MGPEREHQSLGRLDLGIFRGESRHFRVGRLGDGARLCWQGEGVREMEVSLISRRRLTRARDWVSQNKHAIELLAEWLGLETEGSQWCHG
jgi:hypothetical protein